MKHHVYTVRLPNNELTGLFVNYLDALNWKDIMEGEDTVMIHVDHEEHQALAMID